MSNVAQNAPAGLVNGMDEDTNWSLDFGTVSENVVEARVVTRDESFRARGANEKEAFCRLQEMHGDNLPWQLRPHAYYGPEMQCEMYRDGDE